MQFALVFSGLFLYLVIQIVEIQSLNEGKATNSPSSEKFGEISEKKCKEFGQGAAPSSTEKSNSLAKEFPHMALLGYGNETDKVWACGGSLISSRHVLTAAHCLITRDIDIKFVRLGDVDTKSTTDIADPQDFTISKKIVHPNYDPRSKKNDIAIAELDKDVRITEFVRPACLHLGSPLKDSSKLIATGWGVTELIGDYDSKMLKIQMTIANTDECKKKYPANRITIDDEKQLCALPTGALDTCQGFGGAPLQVFNSTGYEHINIVGVISFGKGCGLNIPGINTRVSHYVPWIESIVWKN